MQGERMQGLPNEKESYYYAAFFLPRVLLETADIEIMRRVTDWLALKFGNTR